MVCLHLSRMMASLLETRVLNQPIARFDPKSGKVYMEHADGTKTLVGEAMKKGRYGK